MKLCEAEFQIGSWTWGTEVSSIVVLTDFYAFGAFKYFYGKDFYRAIALHIDFSWEA